MLLAATNNGDTPLDVAETHGHCKTAKLLSKELQSADKTGSAMKLQPEKLDEQLAVAQVAAKTSEFKAATAKLAAAQQAVAKATEERAAAEKVMAEKAEAEKVAQNEEAAKRAVADKAAAEKSAAEKTLAAIKRTAQTCPRVSHIPSNNDWEPLIGAAGWGSPNPDLSSVYEGECDIETTPYEPGEELIAKVQRHLEEGRPLRITGVGRQLLARHSFLGPAALKRPPWGDLRYEVGDIPYAADFRDEKGRLFSLKRYIQGMESNTTARTGSRAGLDYWFSEHFTGVSGDTQLIKEKRSTAVLRNTQRAVFGMLGIRSDKDSVLKCQLAIGPMRTGAPIHFHGLALNILFAGAKRWFVAPPTSPYWSNAPIEEWFRQPERPKMLECMQRPGDVLLVPEAYSHGVLNLDTSVGLSWLFDTIGGVADNPNKARSAKGDL